MHRISESAGRRGAGLVRRGPPLRKCPRGSCGPAAPTARRPAPFPSSASGPLSPPAADAPPSPAASLPQRRPAPTAPPSPHPRPREGGVAPSRRSAPGRSRRLRCSAGPAPREAATLRRPLPPPPPVLPLSTPPVRPPPPPGTCHAAPGASRVRRGVVPWRPRRGGRRNSPPLQAGLPRRGAAPRPASAAGHLRQNWRPAPRRGLCRAPTPARHGRRRTLRRG